MTRGTTRKILRDQANNIHVFPNSKIKQNLYLSPIKPLTKNQHKAIQAYEAGKNLLMTGSAGTGKTFLAIYLALKEIMLGTTSYHKLMIIRSALPTRDIGALPGTIEEKTSVYELPYHLICEDLFDDPNAYNKLKQDNIISFITSSYIRGITLSNCIVLVDELQNMQEIELLSVITRIGQNCKIILAGDSVQTDHFKTGKSGFKEITDVLIHMNAIEAIKFDVDDIVRSGLVKEFLTIYDGMKGSGD